VITNYVSDYINLLVRIAHIICNHNLLQSNQLLCSTKQEWKTNVPHCILGRTCTRL